MDDAAHRSDWGFKGPFRIWQAVGEQIVRLHGVAGGFGLTQGTVFLIS